MIFHSRQRRLRGLNRLRSRNKALCNCPYLAIFRVRFMFIMLEEIINKLLDPFLKRLLAKLSLKGIVGSRFLSSFN